MGRLSTNVDGVTIDSHKGVVSGAFEVTDAEASLLALDEEVMIVVTARVKAPRFKEAANGDLSRIAVLKVKEARVVSNPQMFRELADNLNFEDVVLDPTPVQAPPVFIPTSPATQLDRTMSIQDDEVEVQVVAPPPVFAPAPLQPKDDALRKFLYEDAR